jgi:hypothetical protein
LSYPYGDRLAPAAAADAAAAGSSDSQWRPTPLASEILSANGVGQLLRLLSRADGDDSAVPARQSGRYWY